MGQGGAFGGAAGDAAGGRGGEGGEAAVAECVPALRAMVRAIFGDFPCPELETCIVESCASELAAAAGDGWRAGDYTGGICADYVSCVDTCECESECTLDCRTAHANGNACLDAVIEVSLCRNDACPTAVDHCAP